MQAKLVVEGKPYYFEERNYLKTAGSHVPDTPNLFFPNHYHDQLEIYFLTEGESTIFVGTEIFHMHEGEILVTPPNTFHSSIYKDHKNCRYLINCDTDFLPKELLDKINGPFRLNRDPELLPEIERLFQIIKKEYRSEDPFSKIVLENTIVYLIVMLIREKDTSVACDDADNLIENAISLIQHGYAGRITLTSVARSCFVSPEHLSREFRRQTGMRFCDFLMNCRLKNARKLLIKTRLSISEIAYACGFNDSNYFTASFKKHTGRSPSAFRAENAEG